MTRTGKGFREIWTTYISTEGEKRSISGECWTAVGLRRFLILFLVQIRQCRRHEDLITDIRKCLLMMMRFTSALVRQVGVCSHSCGDLVAWHLTAFEALEYYDDQMESAFLPSSTPNPNLPNKLGTQSTIEWQVARGLSLSRFVVRRRR